VRRTIAIVGFGFMGRTHYGAWKKCRGAEVVAVCDSNLAQLTAKVVGNIKGVADNAALPKSVKVWSDFDAMLAAGGIDVVDITLPTPLHAAMSVRALDAGCHVLCEKPMALATEDCDRMIDAAKKARRELFVAQCVRFSPDYAFLAKLIRSGKYGAVIAAEFTRFMSVPKWSAKGKSWFMDEAKSGGLYVDAHIHDADYILSVFGAPQSFVSKCHRGKDGCVDHLTTSYDYPDGKLVTAAASFAAAGSLVFDAAARVFFEKATVYLGGAYAKPLTVYPAKGKSFSPKLPTRTGYEEEIRCFLKRINGDHTQSFAAEDARASLELVLSERDCEG